MLPLIFRCSVFKEDVQHCWITTMTGLLMTKYEATTCQACTRLHFVNRKTGKLLGDVKK
jgi:hypothetical protein